MVCTKTAQLVGPKEAPERSGASFFAIFCGVFVVYCGADVGRSVVREIIPSLSEIPLRMEDRKLEEGVDDAAGYFVGWHGVGSGGDALADGGDVGGAGVVLREGQGREAYAEDGGVLAEANGGVGCLCGDGEVGARGESGGAEQVGRGLVGVGGCEFEVGGHDVSPA